MCRHRHLTAPRFPVVVDGAFPRQSLLRGVVKLRPRQVSAVVHVDRTERLPQRTLGGGYWKKTVISVAVGKLAYGDKGVGKLSGIYYGDLCTCTNLTCPISFILDPPNAIVVPPKYRPI